MKRSGSPNIVGFHIRSSGPKTIEIGPGRWSYPKDDDWRVIMGEPTTISIDVAGPCTLFVHSLGGANGQTVILSKNQAPELPHGYTDRYTIGALHTDESGNLVQAELGPWNPI